MKKIFIIFLLFTGFSTALSGAGNNIDEPVPDVSIGINANLGTFDMIQKNMDLENKPGLYTGAGISVEKMIYPNFGFGSGIQYRYFNTEFTMDQYDITWTFQSINIPFLMILSLSGGDSALNLVGGVVYSHIYYSKMKSDSTATEGSKTDNALKFSNRNQIGVTGGVLFRIKATEYTDFVFGVMGEYYPTNLLYEREGSSDELNMISYSLTTGWMFRTNIFPGSAKNNKL